MHRPADSLSGSSVSRWRSHICWLRVYRSGNGTCSSSSRRWLLGARRQSHVSSAASDINSCPHAGMHSTVADGQPEHHILQGDTLTCALKPVPQRAHVILTRSEQGTQLLPYTVQKHQTAMAHTSKSCCATSRRPIALCSADADQPSRQSAALTLDSTSEMSTWPPWTMPLTRHAARCSAPC